MIEQVDPETGTEGLMQVGGVGSGHDTYSHQVTGCIHEHGENKDVGGAGTKLGSVQTIQTAEEVLQENSSVNLMSWVQNISSKGKQLLQKIWGESKEANDAITSQNGNGNHIAGQETLVTGNSVGVKTTMNRAAVETAATHTYFRPVEAKDTMPANPFQKVRYQVQKVARKLMDRLPVDFWDPIQAIFCRRSRSKRKKICGREVSINRMIRRSSAFSRMKAI